MVNFIIDFSISAISLGFCVLGVLAVWGLILFLISVVGYNIDRFFENKK